MLAQSAKRGVSRTPDSPVIFRNVSVIDARGLHETFAHARQIQFLGEVARDLAFFFYLVHFALPPLLAVGR